MKNKYDTIIVGGGIAGLMTALRLAQNRQKVLVIEKGKIGNGATVSNHGTVHSGAHYMQRFDNIVKNCQEAQRLFFDLFSGAKVPCKNSVYIINKTSTFEFVKGLGRHNISFVKIPLNEAPELNPKVLKESSLLGIVEGVYSSRKLLHLLLSYCKASGVQFLLNTKVENLVIRSRKIEGVEISSHEKLTCDNVVLASGFGTLSILKSIHSNYSDFFHSRLATMAYLPNAKLDRGFVFADLGKPVIMPELYGGSLASVFGIDQPPVSSDRNFSVNFENAQTIIRSIKRSFNAKFVDTHHTQFFVSAKTDYINNSAIKNLANPGYSVIDHTKLDNLAGLYTIVTGKMTLAFHCSRDAAALILGTSVDLNIKKIKKATIDPNMVITEPWSDFSNK